VLALEDVHWADAASVVTLNRLVRRTGQMPLLLILTARPSPRPDELSRLVETLDDVGTTRVRLGPLDDGAVRALVSGIVRGSPRPELLEQVRRAAGNPLFITELLGARSDDARGARPDAELAATSELPPTVRLAILHRLRYLPNEVLDTLRVAAVLGSTFSVVDLSSVTGRTPLQLASDLRPALEGAVLGEHGDRLAFRHDLVRDAVYFDLPLAMRMALHRQIAGALAASGSGASQVAAHMSLGAEPGDREAVEWLRKAAAEVAGRDPGVAAEHLHKALALMEPDDAERPQVMVELAERLNWTSRFEHAIGVLEEALRLAGPDDRWKILYSLSRALVFMGREAEAMRRLDQWHGTGTPEQRVLYASARANSRSFTGDFDGALAEARAAVALADKENVPQAALGGLTTVLTVSYLRGDLDSAISYGRRQDAVFAQERVPGLGFLTPQQNLGPYGLALLDADRAVEAEEVLRQDVHLYETTGNIKYLPFAHHCVAISGFFTGRWDDAVAESEAGMALAQELDISYGRVLGAVVLGSLAVHRDDLETARRYRAVADDDVAAGHAAPWEAFLLPWLKGQVSELEGDPATALANFGSYWSPVQAFGLLSVARFGALEYCRALVSAGRTTDAHEVADRMDEVAERSGGVASATAKARHCRGLADGDPELLLQAVEHYKAAPRPVELAQGWFDAGSMLTANGDVEQGVALLRDASERFEAVGARRDVRKVTARLRALGMPAGGRGRRARPSTGWESLTTSETEVVTRLCQGMTNRKIGEALYVSPRTVESHLSHVFQKLGVRSRAELLATALPRLTAGGVPGA
jgi:DNA-binding CsgD family transcriptional regulator